MLRWIALKVPHGSDYIYIESPQVQQGEFPQTAQGLRRYPLSSPTFPVYEVLQALVYKVEE